MTDDWSGASKTVGDLTYTFNSDGTAVRFSRVSGAIFPAGIADIVVDEVRKKLSVLSASVEAVATALDGFDPTFAAAMHAQAAMYKAAAGVA